MNPSNISGVVTNEVVSTEETKSTSLTSTCCDSSQNEMKRVAAKEKIERYYYQLTDGCGDLQCDNEFCASSQKFLYLGISRNQAAGRAVELFKNRCRLCDMSTKKQLKAADFEASSVINDAIEIESRNSVASNMLINYNELLKKNESVVLTDKMLCKLIDDAQKSNSWTKLASVMFSTFSNPDALIQSFSLNEENNEFSKTSVKSFNALEKPGISLDADAGHSRTPKSQSKAMDVDATWSGIIDDGDRMEEGSAVDGPGYQQESENELSGVEVYEAVNSKNATTSFFSNYFEEHPRGVSYRVTVNVNSLVSCYNRLSELSDSSIIGEPLKAALSHLARKLESSFLAKEDKDNLMLNPNLPNIYAIILEMPLLDSLELLEQAVPNFYRTVSLLPVSCQMALVEHWSRRYGSTPDGVTSMRRVVCAIQQMITVRVVMTPWTVLDQTVNDDEAICGAVVMLKLFYYASMLGGRMDERWLRKRAKKSSKRNKSFLGEAKSLDAFSVSQIEKYDPSTLLSDEDEEEEDRTRLEDSFFRDIFNMRKERRNSNLLSNDLLGEELGARSDDCREPLLSRKEFINETLSEAIEMDKDYAFFHVQPKWRFSFMANPFVLTTTAKQMGLYFDSRIKMFDERRATLVQNVLYAGSSTASMTSPYLRLNVRRDHIIGDALVNLEAITMNSPQDLKKQLFVEFEGEQGVDEGGVSKEFFQLIVEELFNPDFGMFRLDDETQTFWFNEFSFENDAEFTLIGILIGLAIYNNVILDVQFPMVLYRKLLSRKGSFDDLLIARPTLGNSLLSLLNYDGNVEDLMQTFSVSTVDVFGNVHTHDLKPGGSDAVVTNENKKEFVELYADFLLNKSVEKQFKAFQRGFKLVTDESPLAQLFTAEELELLICGSDESSDFHALEESTEYDGGYMKDSLVIKYFWETVHSMTEEQKKKLLQFTTGSDRVPIGGLAKLKLIIARNGQDTDRLPTSHTCFNVLLLPEYSTKEKLQERLLKAITYSKGFGML